AVWESYKKTGLRADNVCCPSIYPSGVWLSRNPITGIAACCARAASGHAAAAPPSSDMNARRFMSDTGLSLPPAIPHPSVGSTSKRRSLRSVYLGASLPWNARQVLGTDLDRSVSEAARLTPQTTISARVLTTMALISACSAAGTANLSRVCWRSSRKASHPVAVIPRCWCESFIERPVYFCGPPAAQQTISVTRYLKPGGGTRS